MSASADRVVTGGSKCSSWRLAFAREMPSSRLPMIGVASPPLLLTPIVFIASAQSVPLSLSSEPSDEQSHAHARPNCRLASMEDKIDAVLAHLLSGKGF